MKSKACWFTAVISAFAGSFIYYCEKLQFLSLTKKGLSGRLGISALLCGFISLLLCSLIEKAFIKTKKQKLFPVLISGLILSVCFMVWFPVPCTGLYGEHTLEIRAVSDENGSVLPVTLTWLNTDHGDIPLRSVKCEGSCLFGEFGPTVSDESSLILWKGKTGDKVTIEFVSGADQGIAEISWDGTSRIVSLNNNEFDRLSYDFTFPVNNGLPEFIAVWFISFLLVISALFTFIIMMPGKNVRVFGICAFIIFVIFRIFQFRTIKEPLFFIDSESYLGMSQMTIQEILQGTEYCHKQFWYCIARPAFIPLIYKVCRQDPYTITVVQLVLSLLSWGFFAQRASCLCLTERGKKTAIFLSLGLGCIPNVTRWDGMIMSESLSLSAALLFMGGLFWLTKPSAEKRWSWIPSICTAFGALCYAQSRDSAVWAVILTVFLLLCLLKIRKNRKAIIILCIMLAGICWITSRNTGDRWQFPFENVLFNRIARNPQAEAYFISEGMPTPQRMDELYGVEHMMGSELFNSEEMAPLREWIISDGLKTYIKYMLRNPIDTLRMAWKAGFENEAFEQIDYTFSPAGFHTLLPDPVIKFFACNLPAVLIMGIGLICIFTAFRTKHGERFVFPVSFVLSAYLFCSGVLIADEYEFSRHAMVIILMMKASVWPLIIMLFEEASVRTGYLQTNHLQDR